MMITGISLLPPLHEHHNENDESQDESENEEEEEESDDDCYDGGGGPGCTQEEEAEEEAIRRHLETIADCSPSNYAMNGQEESLILTSQRYSPTSGGQQSNNPSWHDLSCQAASNEPAVENNNPSSIIKQQTPVENAEQDSVILRSPSVVLTTNMALDSFRRSVCLDDDANVDLDAILNDLESLTQMLKSELRPVPSQQSQVPSGPHRLDTVIESPTPSMPRSGSDDSGTCHSNQTAFLPAMSSCVELRRKPPTGQLSVSPTKGVVVDVHHHQNPQQHHISWNGSNFSDDSNQHHQPSPPNHQGMTTSNRASMGDSDSAFSESGSTPTGGSNVGNSAGSMSNSQHQLLVNSSPSSQNSAMTGSLNEGDSSKTAKEEKIRIALEKIREAQIRKLCIRIFGPEETTSKTLFIDETTSVRQVIHLLAAKNHVEPNVNWAVVEYYPDLYAHRVIEDHESLVANMLQWKPDSPNTVRFEMRPEKYDLFSRPELYLSSELDDDIRHIVNADHSKRLQLVQECFSDISVRLPHLEMGLHLKHPTKKSWRKLTFFMRGSGLYYTTKSKGKTSAKDLVCLAQFEHVNLYKCSADFQKKFKAPTPFGFVLKHPQLQKRCKYVHYLCAESEAELARWCTCIRLAKYGKQLAENYSTLAQDIAAWPNERGLSAAGLLQKVTGVAPPVVTPLRHSFTPSMGSGTTITDDRSTPSSSIMSKSAAARLASSAEQLMSPENLLHPFRVTNQYQIEVETLSRSSNSPRPPLSPNAKAKKKHLRFSDDPDQVLSDAQIYDNPSGWQQHSQQNVNFPPPPPVLYHDYDLIAEKQGDEREEVNVRGPSPPSVVVPPSEMQYGIIIKPPVPAKPRNMSTFSPKSEENAGQQVSKPPPPPRVSAKAPPKPSVADITGELDKLLSARAARLERLWNQEDDQPASSQAYPPPSSLLMASQELTSEETGTIKKRPPPPPRRS